MIDYKDVEGATSTLIDGFKLAEHIRKEKPEYFTLLSKVSVPYQVNLNNEAIYRTRRYTFGVDDNDDMSAIHLNNIDRKPLDAVSLSEARKVLSCDADEAITKMYAAMRYLHHLLIYNNQFAYKFDLHPGRMILLNNHRMFHARDELVAGFRVICGTHQSESEWLSKVESLERKYT